MRPQSVQFYRFNGFHSLTAEIDRVFNPQGCLLFKPLKCTYTLCLLRASAGVLDESTLDLQIRAAPQVFHLICAGYLAVDFFMCYMYFVKPYI
jgi:hypothetical protein